MTACSLRMTDPLSLHFLILDDEWRPCQRLPGSGDWRTTMDALLQWDSHWLAIEQRRPDENDARPRWTDIRLTRALSQRLRPMEIAVADHVIHSGHGRFSFREAGLL